MTRKVEPVQSVPDSGALMARKDTHPAFGVAVVTRGQGTPRTLFQSDLQHSETVTLSISTAVRYRDLHRDWTHPAEHIVEVEMSLAQWSALVSSVGIGSGVPVTIRSRESDRQVPLLPYEPRIAETVSEAQAAVRELLADAQKTLLAVTEAVESKQGVRAVREALSRHTATLRNAESNAGFAVKSMKESAETVVSQARADIESQIVSTQAMLSDRASIDAPKFDVSELEQ